MSDGSNINYNPYANDPELADLVFELDRSTKLSLNCHAIGVVQSFDKTTQTATAQIVYQRTSFEDPNGTGVYVPVQTPYAPLAQCPVVFLGGGGANLQFPVAKGDECLICFGDRDIDNWWGTGGTSVQLNSGRLHSTADAVIVVGVRSKPKVIKNFDGSRVVLAGSDSATGALVGVSASVASLETGGASGTKVAAESKATIKVGSDTLGAEMASLMTALNDPTTGLVGVLEVFATGLTPVNLAAKAGVLATALAAVTLALNAVNTRLGNTLT